MIGRKAVIGLSLLSVLVFCAVAAPSAFATKGTTGFTCVKVATNAQFKDAHCKEAGSGEGYRHEEIAPGPETLITATNKNTANNTTEHTTAVLHATVGGLAATVTCTTVHGTGTGTNNLGPPMNVTGTVTTEFSECMAHLNGKTCESVNLGKPVISKALISTPTEAHEVKFSEDGEPLAKFTIHCAGKTFDITVKGSATAIPEGATLKFTDASTTDGAGCPGKGLCVGGQPASFEATTTQTMSTSEPGITLTTTDS